MELQKLVSKAYAAKAKAWKAQEEVYLSGKVPVHIVEKEDCIKEGLKASKKAKKAGKRAKKALTDKDFAKKKAEKAQTKSDKAGKKEGTFPWMLPVFRPVIREWDKVKFAWDVVASAETPDANAEGGE